MTTRIQPRSLPSTPIGKAKDDGKGHLRQPLPDALNPVSGIHELTVLDANQQTVLTADLAAPDKFEYLLKGDLSTDTIEASLDIKANAHKAKLNLKADGLSPNSQYSLA